MDLKEWCLTAQDDQNVQGISHLYSNFRYSVRGNLLPAPARGVFEGALRHLPNAEPEEKLSDVDGGHAGLLVELARDLLYRRDGAAAAAYDFRLSGPVIDAPKGSVFAGLRMQSAPSAASATLGTLTADGKGAGHALAGKGLIAAAVRPAVPAIRWLTRPDDLLHWLSRAAAASGTLDATAFFRELVAALGLKPRAAPETLFTLGFFRLRNAQVLRRPHAISTGYADRHCSASDHLPFGSTADNRTGRAGLPEAVVLATDIEEIPPAHDDHRALRTRIATVAPWVGPLDDADIAARLPTAEVHGVGSPYADLRTVFINRMDGTTDMCGNDPGKGCLCAVPHASIGAAA